MENRVYFRTKPSENVFFFNHLLPQLQVNRLHCLSWMDWLNLLGQSIQFNIFHLTLCSWDQKGRVRFAMLTAASHTCCWLLYLHILIYLILILLVLPFEDNFFWQSSAIPIRSSEDSRCMFRDWCCSHGHVCLNNSLCRDFPLLSTSINGLTVRCRRGSPKQQPAAVMASRVGLLLALGATRWSWKTWGRECWKVPWLVDDLCRNSIIFTMMGMISG